MAITYYPNGAGGTTGADLAVLKRVTKSGLTYFLGNAVAGASNSFTGLDRGKPLLTMAQAVTNAAAGDTIVVLENHNETVATTVVLSEAGMSIVGEGTGSTVPRLICGGLIAMLDVTSAGVLLDNLYFPASVAVPTARVRVAASDVRMNALQFDCGASDTSRALQFTSSAAGLTLTNARFTSSSPLAAIAIESAAVAGLTMDRVTFDGGSFEWADYAFKATGAITRLRATRMYQLNGSDAILPTGSTGDWQVEVSTGNSRLNWTV